MAIWGTSVSLPAGATVGGKSEAQIGEEIQAALESGDKSKLDSILGSLKSAGHSGSYNASEEFLDVVGKNKNTGIVPKSVANSSEKTAQYVAQNQMGAGTTTTEQPDYINYVLNNPGLRENAEAYGYTRSELEDFGKWHWDTYGQREYAEGGRLNTPFDTALPGEREAAMSAEELSRFQESVRRGVPSEMWEARGLLGDEAGVPWNLGQFRSEGWRVAPDEPYGLGILDDQIYVREGYGQLGRREDPRFLQDRYEEAAIANDFPKEWVQGGKWSGPAEMAPYWNQLTNAIRNEQGWLRSSRDLPPGQGVIPDIAPGTYGTLGGGRGLGGSGEYLATPYTRPALQDWSHLAPPEMPGLLGTAQAQQSLLGNNLAAYQPQAQGGVIDYAPRGGSRWAPRTYTVNPLNNASVVNNQQNNQNNQNNQQKNLQNLMALNQRNLAAHQDMYPQHSAQAADKGLTYGTPAYNQWIAANKQEMIDLGIDISENKFGGDRYTSQNWIDYQSELAAKEAQNG